MSGGEREERERESFTDLIFLFRYGLPVNFQAILIHPNKKSQKRLKDVLQQLYGHLDGSGGSGAGNQADVSGGPFIEITLN